MNFHKNNTNIFTMLYKKEIREKRRNIDMRKRKENRKKIWRKIVYTHNRPGEN